MKLNYIQQVRMSFDLVFFGGTGDLTWRKLMPALFQAFRHGKLPAGGRILSVARDEQSDDKYRGWLKERFQEVEGGVEMEDIVHYVMPLGWLGRLAHAVFVRDRLRAIFDFRRDYLATNSFTRNG